MRCREPSAVGCEAGQQEHVLHAVGFGALDRFRFLRAMARDRENDQIVGLGPLNKIADVLQDVGAVGLRIDQRDDVARPHRAQRSFDIPCIRHRSLERTHVLICVDADEQGANGAAVRILQIQRGGRRGKTRRRCNRDRQVRRRKSGRVTRAWLISRLTYWRINSTRRFKA